MQEVKKVVKTMKINEIREKSSSDLANLEAELKQELFKLRFQNATNQLTNLYPFPTEPAYVKSCYQ